MTSDLSLRRFSLASAVWYCAVLVGWSLVALALYSVVRDPAVELAGPLAMTACLVVLLELLPLIQGRGHDPQGIVMSTAFTCALLVLWGIWPAVIMVAIASIASDLRARKQVWKLLFNPAQYAVSVAAGYLVMVAFGIRPSLAEPLADFRVADMAWIVPVWIAYFAVNLALVAGVLSWMPGWFRAVVVDDFLHYTAMTFAVLSLSPLIVVVAQHTWTMLPLLLVPLLLLYYTAQMALEREVEATHDALTALPNRASFHFELDAALDRYRRDDQPFGLLVIDLDDFKRVNDTLGHQVGDALLVHLAHRLQRSVRPSDLVARLGGDEFAVIVANTNAGDVHNAAERVRTACVDAIELGGLLLSLELSIGIAFCPDHGLDGTTLLQRADVAMYVAKQKHSGIETYSSDRDDNSTDRLGLLGELRQALEDDVLELYYQPKVTTRDSTPIGAEALVRWFHPTRGYVPPDEFIPLAEGSGIMPLLTERVIGLALEQLARWRDEGLHVPIAVNIAPTDLSGDNLTYLVKQGLAAYDLPPGLLQLEITERILAHELADVRRTLDRLRAMGVSISLDDFGTGYSSLQRVSYLPVDEIKIDRIFVSCLSDGKRGIGIVRALIDLAHALGVPAIAEGVETQHEWHLLNTLGCDGVQGWHVAMPMPGDEATAWMRSQLDVRRLPNRDELPATGTENLAPSREEVG